MADAFQPGDLVQLKSGGEVMTVESIGGNGSVNCIWMEKQKVHHENFPAVVLKKFEPHVGVF